jgi:hypothetical protein
VDVRSDEHALQFRRLSHELQVLLARAEAHDPLDTGPAVPGPVEHDDLAGGRQVLEVALEVPLGGFALVGLLQRHDARPARVEVLGQPLDRAALAGGVTPLEQDQHLLPGRLDPLLQLQQFDLQRPLLAVILLAGYTVRIGIILPPGLDDVAVLVEQQRLVLVVVVDAVCAEVLEQGEVDIVQVGGVEHGLTAGRLYSGTHAGRHTRRLQESHVISATSGSALV